MRMIVLPAIGLTLALGLASVHADELQVPGPSAAPSRAGLPARGTTMSQVESRFGAPSERLAAVGQPPITRWVYPGFVVFFEHNLVIHAVATPATQPAH